MAVKGRQERYLYLVLARWICASTLVVWSTATSFASSARDARGCPATSCRVICAEMPVMPGYQNLATEYCSGVRAAPARPIARLSARSLRYVEESSAGGGPGSNWSLLERKNGFA